MTQTLERLNEALADRERAHAHAFATLAVAVADGKLVDPEDAEATLTAARKSRQDLADAAALVLKRRELRVALDRGKEAHEDLRHAEQEREAADRAIEAARQHHAATVGPLAAAADEARARMSLGKQAERELVRTADPDLRRRRDTLSGRLADLDSRRAALRKQTDDESSRIETYRQWQAKEPAPKPGQPGTYATEIAGCEARREQCRVGMESLENERPAIEQEAVDALDAMLRPD